MKMRTRMRNANENVNENVNEIDETLMSSEKMMILMTKMKMKVMMKQ